jgi:hypothetical protein
LKRPARRPLARPVAEPLEGRAYLSSNALKFAKPVEYAAGPDPADLVAADLTGNGIDDLIVADYGAPQIAVLMGNGNGTFATTPVTYPITTPAQSIAVGDFNGDGLPDIAVVGNGADVVDVLMNEGNGTFAPYVEYAVGLRPEAVVAADVNGDGHLDLVTANQGDGTVTVLLNNGDGTFASGIEYLAGPGPDALAAGDLNGDGHPDLVVTNPSNNTIDVLLNKGDGTFPAIPTAYAVNVVGRSVTVADVNNDARPDIILADLRSGSVEVLDNQGAGLFTAAAVTLTTGGFPFAVAAADLNGSNRIDLISVDNRDNAVGVLVHNANGSYTVVRSFPAGTAPEAVVVADVNGDGKPDLITADFNDNAVAVLINETNFPPLTATTLTLTAGQNPVQFGNPLTLTATISPAPTTALAAGRVVQFLDGDKVLGIAKLQPNGTATIITTLIPVGAASIAARYNGNAHYAPSAAAINENVLTSAAATPLVAAAAVTLTGRAGSTAIPLLPGDTGSANVTIVDQGAGRSRGTVAVSLSIAPVADPTDAEPLALLGTSTFAANLRGGTARTVPVRFTVPADLAAYLTTQLYTIFAALAPVATLTAAQVSATPAATFTPATVELAFGAAGIHLHYKLTTTLSNGATVALSITGPGSGTLVDAGGGGVDLSLVDTTPGSTVSIVPAGNGPVSIASLSDPAPLGGVAAAGVPLVGAITLGTGVRRLTLGDVTDSTITFGPTYPAVVSLGAVTGTTLLTSGAMQSLSVASWDDTATDSVTATGIRGPLTSAGDFGARLSLSGDRRPEALGSISIAGTVDSPTWLVDGGIGAVSVGSVTAGFSGSAEGAIASLSVAGNFSGVLAARTSFGDVTIGGDLTDADILAGATLGTDDQLGGGNDTFGVGRITSIHIGGNVVDSLVAAGFDPASDAPFTPVGGTLLPGGRIGSITVVGSVDAASRFAAASTPAVGT